MGKALIREIDVVGLVQIGCAMDAEYLNMAVETARRSGITPKEALIHWDLAGGLEAGERSLYWVAVAIDLAADPVGGTSALANEDAAHRRYVGHRRPSADRRD